MASEFLSPIDVCNRALQHVGSERMDATLGFNEGTKRAAETSFAYGKLRTAELQRNAWRFATKRAVLRAIDSNTMLLAPTLYASTTTYFLGSIVADQNANLWISNTVDNLGNDPLGTTFWDPYFGPMTVSLYDSSQTYSAGELVYTFSGDGSYNVYLSEQNTNVVHPALSNLWASTTVYYKDQVVIEYPAWAIGTTYSQGQAVLYTDGNVYASLVNSNLGNTPSATSTKWALVPTLSLQSQSVPISTVVTPPTVSPVLEWAQGTTYSSGNVVMFAGSMWLSIQNSNSGQFPNASGSTYWKQVTNGTLYQSLIDLSLGNDPANAPALWASGTTYATGNKVGASDGQIYTSLSNGNVGHDPTLDAGVHWQATGIANPWTTVFTQGGGNPLWTQIGGASFPFGVGLKALNFSYWPLEAGPSTQSVTRNAFRLPAGFLKHTLSDPKAGSMSFLGAPSNNWLRDWLFEGDYIVSRDGGPIVLRFIADVVDVTKMDPMFCEGLACRIAEAVCEPLTQSTAKLDKIGQEYQFFMSEARKANAVEIGSEEPPLDDFIACRW